MFPKTVGATFLALCNSINTPRSLTCALLWKHGEHAQLLELSINSENYHASTPIEFRNDYLVTEYLRKYEALNVSIDTDAAAYDSFTAAELTCAKKNRTLQSYPKGASTRLMRVISRAQVLIEECIGAAPSWKHVLDDAKWGKGSTFSIKGEEVRLDTKVLEDKISITREALPYFRAAVANDFAFLRARGIVAEGPVSLLATEFNIVRGCRVTRVLKNAKTKRTIAIEPSGNIFLQLGFGSLLRRCLMRCGINLNDQSINQELARLAAALGLATVDLKQASDSICRELVWLLLPFRWALSLDGVRSHEAYGCHFNDDWSSLHKFSSMGNGFTFELESLIFWALSQALCDVERHKGLVSVYGDDIILPATAYPALVEVFDYCGFTVNSKKSHVDSIFYESCGKHYFKGCDVSPIYQKEALTTVDAFYRHHNRWVYHAIDRGCVLGLDAQADKQLRRAIHMARYNRLDNPHIIPILGDDKRTLDGGLAKSAQNVKGRFVGVGFRVRSWVFVPTEALCRSWVPSKNGEADEQALYAAHLRLVIRKRITMRSRAVLPRAAGFSPRIFRENLEGFSAYKEIATWTELADPVTGAVTLRGQGSYETRKRIYDHMCDLRWV